MSRTNYEAVSDYVGHWAGLAFDRRHRSNQIESHCSHFGKKPWCGPGAGGAGLVRAWRGPGAGSKTEAAEPALLQDRSRGAGLAFKVTHGL